MKYKRNLLYQELKSITQWNIKKAVELQKVDLEKLQGKPNKESWSALECIEHLNFYGNYYLPEIEHQILGNRFPDTDVFKSNWLGNYFANMMKATPKMKKIKSPNNANPEGKAVSEINIQTFLKQQELLLTLLDKSLSVNWTKTKTGTSLSKWVRLRLGDTFRVVIYHNERHLIQALKAASS